MNKSVVVASFLIASFASAVAGAQSPADTAPADNSKANSSPSHTAESADSQKNDRTDLELTRQIRRSVMSDKSLSVYAHNVKIVSVNGTVTLNGVVHSSDEKSNVEAKAVAIAGQDRVIDHMTVAPPK